jgi:hypothetical protein
MKIRTLSDAGQLLPLSRWMIAGTIFADVEQGILTYNIRMFAPV